MTDRMNTVEGQLDTDFNAESDITDEFGLIERGFRENPVFSKHDHPVLIFEVLSCADADEDDHFEIESGEINIVTFGANMTNVRQSAKELVSLVRDFLKSDSWTYALDTKVGASEIITAKENASYRAYGRIPFSVTVRLESSTLK